MRIIDDIVELEALYDRPSPLSVAKVARSLTPLYRDWIAASRFCVLSTAGPDSTDASPRGDDGPVVRIIDDQTLWMPDWRGNNRLDCLRNIVADGRVSLMFMVAGSSNVVRVKAHAVLTDDPAITETFTQGGNHPKLVIIFTVDEIYFQCAKAIMRAGLWSDVQAPTDLPTAGQFLKEMDHEFDAQGYDLTNPGDAQKRMW
ncbi:pyridoxamine 5'-phosphate oxidase family protein [Roseicyclus sp.]|uniref:pyridoxamine 5'-phosphate oxidase family protein n=1 Tax=Roseicyclus sp. TaxID=1914329 RepID=UPI003F6AE27B